MNQAVLVGGQSAATTFRDDDGDSGFARKD
jgi:hypothetical protein